MKNLRNCTLRYRLAGNFYMCNCVLSFKMSPCLFQRFWKLSLPHSLSFSHLSLSAPLFSGEKRSFRIENWRLVSILSQHYFIACLPFYSWFCIYRELVMKLNKLHCCFRRPRYMGSSQFEKPWCTLDGSLAWALQKSMNGCSFFLTSLIFPVRTD
jgi:hypothetical protein